MEEKERPIDLYDTDGGLIRSSEAGNLYSNQTGGVCCNHPVARGFFEPMTIPEEIINICYDQCFIDDEMLQQINDVLKKLALPYRATGGEEAWLHVRGLDFEGILTWENSD